jgi:ribonuclease R
MKSTPLTTESLLHQLQARADRPLLFKEIQQILRIPNAQRHTLKRLLKALLQEGALVKTRENRYGLRERMRLVTGRLRAHREGYGFLLPEEEGVPDIYVPRRGMEGAMDGDRLLVRVESQDDRPSGQVIRILERAHTKVVGRFEAGRTWGYVAPTNPKFSFDLLVPRGSAGEARPGDLVVAEIRSHPTGKRPPEGRVVRVLGRPEDSGVDTEVIIAEHELPLRFPPDVLAQARTIPQTVTPAMRRGRRDLRKLPTVTIDGENARDFDDAVSIEKSPASGGGGYRLWVHVADVGHYVPWDTPLDREARHRGTSVYFPDRVLPMLPHELSNGICSLNPRVDRLAVTVEMTFNRKGERTAYAIYESIIHSHARMTYTAVRKILTDRDETLRARYAALVSRFEELAALAEILRSRRFARGSLDFDLPEPEILLDLRGRPTAILQAERNVAHRLIEECMLAANETVASHLTDARIPLSYRIHEEPDPLKVADLRDLISHFGFTLPHPTRVKPKDLQAILEQTRGHSEERLIHTVVLRSLKLARYSSVNVGHFGLASACYTHFTSPIRRYPDLIVHRVWKESAKPGGMSGRRVRELLEALPGLSDHASQRERIAMEAEREVVNLLKARFLQERIGKEYRGFITGVQPFGFFVQLEEAFVEGLVHVSTLHDDYYLYHDKLHTLEGERTGRRFRLGDPVVVRVEKVDLEARQVDFRLADQGDKRKDVRRDVPHLSSRPPKGRGAGVRRKAGGAEG